MCVSVDVRGKGVRRRGGTLGVMSVARGMQVARPTRTCPFSHPPCFPPVRNRLITTGPWRASGTWASRSSACARSTTWCVAFLVVVYQPVQSHCCLCRWSFTILLCYLPTFIPTYQPTTSHPTKLPPITCIITRTYTYRYGSGRRPCAGRRGGPRTSGGSSSGRAPTSSECGWGLCVCGCVS